MTVAGLADANVVKCSRDVLIKPDVALGDVADKVSSVLCTRWFH